MRIFIREKVVIYLVLLLFTAFALVPLLGLVFTAVTPGASSSGFRIPASIDLINLVEAGNRAHFATSLVFGIVVTTAVALVTNVLSGLAGFSFALLKSFGSNIIFFVLLAGLWTAEAFIIPLYYNLRSTNITDSNWALNLPQIAQSVAFGIFWMRNQFLSFPGDVIDAARLDGATGLRTVWQIIAPPSLPSITTMCFLLSMWTWNEFLIHIVLGTNNFPGTARLDWPSSKGCTPATTPYSPRQGFSSRPPSPCSTSSCSAVSSVGCLAGSPAVDSITQFRPRISPLRTW